MSKQGKSRDGTLRSSGWARLQTWLTLMFLVLTLTLEGMMVLYWVRILEPLLTRKAEVTARSLARSHTQELAVLLENLMTRPAPPAIEADLRTALDRLLLLQDPDDGTPFVEGAALAVDYSVIPASEKSLDMESGKMDATAVFVSEIPLYSSGGRELMGVVRIHNSRVFLTRFKAEVRSAYFIGLTGGFLVLIVIWRLMIGQLRRIQRTETELLEQQAQMIHAGRLTAMGEMASGIAHEINQPLAIIRMASDGLNRYFEKQGEESMEARAAGKIVQQVQRASRIIDNMRSFVRAGSSAEAIISPAGPVEDALSFFREQFRIHEIDLTVEIADGLPDIRANAQKLEQIVVNLLSNARYAVEARKKNAGGEFRKAVAVRLVSDNGSGRVVLEVRDNGIGMSADEAERCLEPFYTTKPVGEGTGLGLSIVHTIVRESDMKIEIDSRPGQGSAFRVFMPVCSEKI
ncbi:MAG: ATP-binding protein [Thermodesulfobacteriota bacterium]